MRFPDIFDLYYDLMPHETLYLSNQNLTFPFLFLLSTSER